MSAKSTGTVVVVDLATRELAEAIHKAGYQAMALILWHDRVTPSAWGVEAAGYDAQLRLSTKDPLEKIEQALREIAPNIVGIVPTNEPSEEVACRLAQKLSLSHNDPEIAAIRWHKAKCKELVQKAGLRVPKFKECYSEKDVRDFAQTLSYPIILKTPAGAASVNVFKCHNLKDLLQKHKIIITTPDDFGSQPNYSVMEEYIGGTGYNVNTFSNGEEVVVTDMWLSETIDTAYAANLHYHSLLVDTHDQSLQAVVEYVKKVVQNTGVKYGPAYTEVKVDKKGPALIEVHARFSGGAVAKIIQNLSNFNPFQATIEVFTKRFAAMPEQVKISSYFAIVSCPSTQTCEKAVINGIEEVRRLPSYYLCDPEWPYPRPIQPTTNLHSFPFKSIWLAGTNQDQIHKDVEQVHKLLHFTCYDNGNESTSLENL